MIMIVSLVFTVAKNVQYLKQVAILMDVELDTFTSKTQEQALMSVLNAQQDVFIAKYPIFIIVQAASKDIIHR